MAENLQKEPQPKAGVAKTKKLSLRVDLTPMVDLGFLLISFFVFTASISQPAVMKLTIPDDKDIIDSSKVPDSKTLNIILGKNNEAYIYNGIRINEIKNVGERSGMREAILKKKQEIKKHYGSDSGMTVLIKPTPASTYENVVNALDEMLICNIKTYVLMDATADELNALRLNNFQ